MQNSLFITSLLGTLSLSGLGYGQAKKDLTNYLSIPGPIYVQKKAHQLAWSSHPDVSLYKHEYLVAGDRFPNYKSMIMIDFIVTESTVEQAVASKISQLEAMKKTNPIVNYNVIINKTTGEQIIDSLLGETAVDDRNNLIERNVFRYKLVRTKAGQQGVLLFGVSTREYGDDINPFLVKLKTDKPVLVNEVAKLTLPEVSLTK